MKKAFIYTNQTEQSAALTEALKMKFARRKIEVVDKPDTDTDVIFAIGGDGTLLRLIHNYDFPDLPICGINTGHLGWFMEIAAEETGELLERLEEGTYYSIPYCLAKLEIKRPKDVLEFYALNEFTVKSESSHPLHINININESFVEEFSGDGITVSTPQGSTGYNLSLEGAIMDPTFKALELTPMAPMQSNAYRTLTSPLIIPQGNSVVVTPNNSFSRTLRILFDGEDCVVDDIDELDITLSERKITLVKLQPSTFWDKLKDKFL